ncbi:hypothetical protein Tco_0352929 [Tanacetum coccineum]
MLRSTSIMVFNVGSTEPPSSLKVENVSLQRWYEPVKGEYSTHYSAYTDKLSALTAENTKLKAQVTGKTCSRPSNSETPKVLAPGMYTNSSKKQTEEARSKGRPVADTNARRLTTDQLLTSSRQMQ